MYDLNTYQGNESCLIGPIENLVGLPRYGGNHWRFPTPDRELVEVLKQYHNRLSAVSENPGYELKVDYLFDVLLMPSARRYIETYDKTVQLLRARVQQQKPVIRAISVKIAAKEAEREQASREMLICKRDFCRHMGRAGLTCFDAENPSPLQVEDAIEQYVEGENSHDVVGGKEGGVLKLVTHSPLGNVVVHAAKAGYGALELALITIGLGLMHADDLTGPAAVVIWPVLLGCGYALMHMVQAVMDELALRMHALLHEKFTVGHLIGVAAQWVLALVPLSAGIVSEANGIRRMLSSFGGSAISDWKSYLIASIFTGGFAIGKFSIEKRRLDALARIAQHAAAVSNRENEIRHRSAVGDAIRAAGDYLALVGRRYDLDAEIDGLDAQLSVLQEQIFQEIDRTRLVAALRPFYGAMTLLHKNIGDLTRWLASPNDPPFLLPESITPLQQMCKDDPDPEEELLQSRFSDVDGVGGAR